MKISNRLEAFEITVLVSLNAVRDKCKAIITRYQESTSKPDVAHPNFIQLEHSETLNHTVRLKLLIYDIRDINILRLHLFTVLFEFSWKRA